MILVTTKTASVNGKKIQKTMDSDSALNLVRKCILMLQPMDETSADLMAIKFMGEVNAGTPKVIENTQTKHSIVFQIQENTCPK